MFPWRTIAGEECSAYFPAGTAQYHINADVAYSIKQYYETTGDDEFLAHEGAEILMDTARLWMGIGAYNPQHPERFGIYEVTGPDEYTAMVNNNFYTNAMAQLHLNFAAKIAQQTSRALPTQLNWTNPKSTIGRAQPKRCICRMTKRSVCIRRTIRF